LIQTLTKSELAVSHPKQRHFSLTRVEQRPTRYIATVKRHSLAAIGAALLLTSPLPSNADVHQSAQVFTNTCAGCHAQGGNIVRRDATLQLDDLTKYGLTGTNELYELIYNGRGSMPGYGDGCAPKGACTFGKRLTDDEIHDLSEYVLARARSSWKE